MQCPSATSADLSYPCSYFSVNSNSKYKHIIPTGELVIFRITARDVNCISSPCISSRQTCKLVCPCCTTFTGSDTGFHASISSTNGDSDVYKNNLNCTIPPYSPAIKGFYFFSCIFNGVRMASSSKLLQIQLTWDTMPKTPKLMGPLTYDVYITSGIELAIYFVMRFINNYTSNYEIIVRYFECQNFIMVLRHLSLMSTSH